MNEVGAGFPGRFGDIPSAILRHAHCSLGVTLAAGGVGTGCGVDDDARFGGQDGPQNRTTVCDV